MSKMNMDNVVKAANMARLTRKAVAQATKFANRTSELQAIANKRTENAKKMIATLTDEELASNKAFIGELVPSAAEIEAAPVE